MNGGGITVCTLCDHPFISHPLPPTFSALAVVSAGLSKQVGQRTKELRKEIALLAKFERVREKKKKAESRNVSFSVRESVCAADGAQAGGDVSDFTVCCCGALCMQLLSACVSPSPSAWEAMIHST